jgi:hypothetical protein
MTWTKMLFEPVPGCAWVLLGAEPALVGVHGGILNPAPLTRQVLFAEFREDICPQTISQARSAGCQVRPSGD